MASVTLKGNSVRVGGQLPQVGDQPLWVPAVVFAGITAILIGIALPEGLQIAVGQPRITIVFRLVEGIAATRQPVAVR